MFPKLNLSSIGASRWWWAIAVLISCGSPGPVVGSPAALASSSSPAAGEPSAPLLAEPRAFEPSGDPGPIPATPADPSWGNSDALVTIVWFGDLQCPFTSRAAATIAQLQARYRPDQLRVVWKNNPLPFHQEAAPAAAMGMAVHAVGGSAAFWKFVTKVFAEQRVMGASAYDSWALEAGVSLESARRQLASGGPTAKVDADTKLAKELGATGTPSFFVNGVAITGAQPLDKFVEVTDGQLRRAEERVAAGTLRNQLYPRLAREAFQKPAPRLAPEPEEDDKSTFRVPVGGSPVRGKPTALVTIIEFSDFQCPFCKRVQGTLDEVKKRYGDDVRIVFKHNPLPFHPRAEPAAELALEARAEKGDDGFFRAHDALYQMSPKLADDDLENLARTLHLDVPKVKKAIATKRYAATIADDVDLADDMKAMGTPHFFINGRRLVGAQPLDKFTSLVDEELTRAKGLVARGVRRSTVYDELQKSAKAADPPETKTIPGPTADQPFLGARDAKVVIVEFSDFQCPFCSRVEPTLQELLTLYPGKIKIVWRHRPLPMHPDAHLASEAAVEAFRQKGNDAFQAYRMMLFKNQSVPNGLKKKALLEYADQLGLDLVRFSAALDDHRNAALVDADSAIADAAGINGTPAFVVNGVFLSGAQPVEKFRKIIDRALGARH